MEGVIVVLLSALTVSWEQYKRVTCADRLFHSFPAFSSALVVATMRKSNQHKFNYLKVRRNVEAKRPDITSNDVQELSTLIQSRCKWPSGLRDFQLQALASLGTGRDVIVHAGTGCGKTAIFAGLHLLPDTAGMFSLLISPLIALQNEQVRVLFAPNSLFITKTHQVKTFDTDFGLKAIAINSSQDGCTDDALAVCSFSTPNLRSTHMHRSGCDPWRVPNSAVVARNAASHALLPQDSASR